MHTFALQTIFLSFLYTCNSHIIDNNLPYDNSGRPELSPRRPKLGLESSGQRRTNFGLLSEFHAAKRTPSPEGRGLAFALRAKGTTRCIPQNALCDDSMWSCCKGTTCEPIPSLNTSMCMPNNNNCRKDSDCSGGLGCMIRLGKCGLCNSIGHRCTLPYDKLECCSSYCALRAIPGASGLRGPEVRSTWRPRPPMVRTRDARPHRGVEDPSIWPDSMGEGQGVCADPTLPFADRRDGDCAYGAISGASREARLDGTTRWGKEDVHISNLHNIVAKNGETIVVQPGFPRVTQFVPRDRDHYDVVETPASTSLSGCSTGNN